MSTAVVTRCKTAAECGYTRPDAAELLRRIRHEVGLAEGHMANVDRLHRELEELIGND